MNGPNATTTDSAEARTLEKPEDWPLIACVAECIGDVARFLLKVEAKGWKGSVMTPVIVQPNWLEAVRATFRSTVPLAELRRLAEGIPDCHRIAESMALMAPLRGKR